MFEIEILHTTSGDKKKKIDTTTGAGRQEAADLVRGMIRSGTAIFVERGKKTYRITDYDPATDAFMLTVERHGKEKPVRAQASKSKATAVPPIRGGAR